LELSLNKRVSCNESIRYSEEKINRIGEKNMNNSGIVEQKYIDSREVAEMVGKQHNDLLKDIRRYVQQLGEGKISHTDFFTESQYTDKSNRQKPCYLVTKKGCEFIAHKLTGVKGTEFTAKYINRFHEMEDVIQTQLPSGNNLIALAVIEAQKMLEQKDKKIDELKVENTRMKPKEIFADAVSASDSSMLVRDVAKMIRQNGVQLGEKRFYKWLREKGYICQGSTAPTQKAMELGLFEIVVRTVERGNGLPLETKTTKITGKGQQYFINKFLCG
jgi:Rha family phage regulatory protein